MKSLFTLFAIYFLIFAIVATCCYTAIGIYWPLFISMDKTPITVTIEYGMTPKIIAQKLQDIGVIKSKSWFLFTAKLYGKTNHLKAGHYEFPSLISPYRAVILLSEGKQKFIKVTIPEGLTSRQIAGLMKKMLAIDSTKFISLTSDSAFVHSLGYNLPSIEGFLFPETYYFTYGMLEKDIIAKMVSQFDIVCNDSLRQVIASKNLSLIEIVTLASIVEGEAMLDEEKPLISSVYNNRLRQGIPLQADPTIQYIILDGPRRLLNRDLEIDSPYNTYKYSGLPPGPINNPGEKAILAAIEPAQTSFLYFVANGKGGHVFSRTFNEHLRAKRNFDIIRRKVKREKQEQISGGR